MALDAPSVALNDMPPARRADALQNHVRCKAFNVFVRAGSQSGLLDYLRPAALVAKQNDRSSDMKWTAPKFVEVTCGMEINRYAPADGDEPVLF